MNEKTRIMFPGNEEGILGMQYNYRTNILIIGGLFRFKPKMEGIIFDFFGINEIPPMNFIQVNKIRYSCKVSKKVYEQAKENLSDAGYILEYVHALGRIMR